MPTGSGSRAGVANLGGESSVMSFVSKGGLIGPVYTAIELASAERLRIRTGVPEALAFPLQTPSAVEQTAPLLA